MKAPLEEVQVLPRMKLGSDMRGATQPKNDPGPPAFCRLWKDSRCRSCSSCQRHQ